MNARAASLVLISICLSGCDGIYTAAETGQESVYVVNRFTGSVQFVRGQELLGVHVPETAVAQPAARPLLETGSFQTLDPYHTTVHVRGKQIGTRFYYHVRVSPIIKNDAEMEAWRTYIMSARTYPFDAVLNISFLAGDFALTDVSLKLANFTREVNGPKEEVNALYYHSFIELGRDELAAVDDWGLGWAGWKPYPEVKPQPEAAPGKT